ncbi:MAG: TonB-dependent receptor [Cyclobacteriaceae bacterium]|nr:TonB-dependent receptor [Cyclobacteriaceae bacterium]
MKKLLPILLFTLIIGSALAQQAVKGLIKDESGQPLPGATISLKGTSAYAITDVEGKFTIAATKELPFTLQVNSVGYKTQEIEIYELSGEPAEVFLKNDNILDEIVVVGYGTQKKSELTGAISSVPEAVLKQPISSIDRALQGAIAGVQVTQTSGQPGGGVSIRIRGGSSIQGGNEPLYVIDGFPVYNAASTSGAISGATINPLSSINPSDIESIDILKDASATAIYGSRGANGVIIITTKKGKADQTSINYEATYGVQTLRKKIDLLNAKQFASLRNDALFDSNPAGGQFQYLTQEEIDQLGSGTDWQDEAFQSAPTQNHQLSLSGGSGKTRYAVSGSYFNQDGIIKNTDFERLSTRINLDSRPTERLNVGLSLTASNTKANVAPSGIVSALLTMPPTATVYEEDGSYTLRNPFENIFSNPIASLNEQINKTSTNRVLGTVFGEYALLDGLTFKVLLGTDINTSKEDNYIPSTIFEGATNQGSASTGFVNSSSWLNENTLNYTKDFGKHSINAVAGFTQQEYTRDIVRTGATNFVTDDVTYNSLQDGAVTTRPYSNNTKWALLSYLGRVNYNFNKTYFLTASLRSDGSSRFGKNNKWGYFPSAAVSWKVSNEDFFRPASRIVTNLKLRASYGATGNQEIGEYQSLATLRSLTYLFGGALVTGFTPNGISNSDLGWETTNQFDAGIDLGILNNRIGITVDAYYKKTKDLLLNVEIPWTSGQATSLQNFGSVENRGLELGINTINLEGKVNWNTSINFSLNRNKVVSIGGFSDSYISGNYIVKVGEPLGTFFGTVTNGILQTGEEATLGAYTGNATPKAGDRLYKDISGDDKFTTALDRTIIGNAQPDFIFGFTNNLTWKGFDLSIFFQGIIGNQILNGNKQTLELFNGQQNASTSALDRWTPTNPSTTIPRAKLDPAPVFSDRLIEDGSFIRLKGLTLGFTLPKPLVERARLTNLRVFIIGQNLLTWTKYTGFDPEITSGNNTVSQGTDAGIYPVSRTISGGLSVTF